MYDVACIGIFVADCIAKTVDKIPERGKLGLIDSLKLYTGGCAMNAGVDMKKLGANVALLGMIGNDGFGTFMLEELKRLGMTTEGVNINFVRLVESRPEWGGNIVQIVAEREGAKAGSKAPRTTIRLVPRKGNYTVLLGTLDGIEAKLNRWVRFVEAGVVNLNEANTLDVSYEGQAVWRIEK